MLTINELNCIAKVVHWSIEFSLDDAEFASDANAVALKVTHRVSSVSLPEPVQLAFTAEERFTFAPDMALSCRIVLHEFAWSALNADTLMLNALIHPCIAKQ
jgi:hypothetical protein